MTDTAAPTRTSPDMRSSAGRRFRKLVAAFRTDLGDGLSAAEVQLVEQAAIVALRAEQMRAEILRGDIVPTDDVIRLSNSATRILSIVADKSRRRVKREISIDEYLAGENNK